MSSNQYTSYTPYNYQYGQSSTQQYQRQDNPSASNSASQPSTHHPPSKPIVLPNPAISSSFTSSSYHMPDTVYGYGRDTVAGWETHHQTQYQPQKYTYTPATTAPEVKPANGNRSWPESQGQQGESRSEKRAERESHGVQTGLMMLGEAASAVTDEQTRMSEQKSVEHGATKEPSQSTARQEPARDEPATGAGSTSANGTHKSPTDEQGSLEAEMRAMMARMRELNGRDPALLSRIWEEERRKKSSIPKPIAQSPAQPASVLPVQTAPPNSSNRAEPAHHSAASANSEITPAPNAKPRKQRKPQKPREPPTSSTPVLPSAPLGPTTTPVQEVLTSASPFGTVWPLSKNSHLAVSVWRFLSTLSPKSISIDLSSIFSMLEGKPSFAEFCERLKAMGFEIDRISMINHMLKAVPAEVPVAAPWVQAALGNPQEKPASPPQPSQPSAPNPGTGISKLDKKPINDTTSNFQPSASVANAGLKPPTTKAEAARKRSFNEIIDLTQMPEEERMEPQPKKNRIQSNLLHSSAPAVQHEKDLSISNKSLVDTRLPTHPAGQFPLNNGTLSTMNSVAAINGVRTVNNGLQTTNPLVENIDYKKSLRRNNYNVGTIARDVLIASGRHPDERPLNEHLAILKQNFAALVTNDADLSTLKWDLIDPDDEAKKRLHVIGGEGTIQSNPSISKTSKHRPSQPPTHQTTPTAQMSQPPPSSVGTGYRTFRPTEYGPDGKPFRKKGRPVGWRKAIHGSPAAQANKTRKRKANPSEGKTTQPSSTPHVMGSSTAPMNIDSSPSAVQSTPRFEPFKCKWQGCQAELHNLETLKRHVYKVHSKPRAEQERECLWDGCGKEIGVHDFMTNQVVNRFVPQVFFEEGKWREHIEEQHFRPISWELGDGRAGGLSDAHDSEAYLSDAQGRRVTPRISVDPKRRGPDKSGVQDRFTPKSSSGPRPPAPKDKSELEAHEALQRLTAQKSRIGGPGMDRGGATLVNDKRRKGLSDHDNTEEELVDAGN